MLVEIGDHMENKDMDSVVAADVAFHEVLYKASRNERLADIVHNLREQTYRFRSFSMNQPGRYAKRGKSIASWSKPSHPITRYKLVN